MIKNKISQAGEPASTARQSQLNPPKRILVVEDDPSLRQVYTEVLTHADYEVDTAEDGAVAWDALQVKGYDLLITDNNMPKVTGVDLLKKVHAAHMTLPVIMATGTYPAEEFSRYSWIQPDATLLKPYTVAEFLGAVKEVLCVNDDVSAELTPPPAWQIRPTAACLRL